MVHGMTLLLPLLGPAALLFVELVAPVLRGRRQPFGLFLGAAAANVLASLAALTLLLLSGPATSATLGFGGEGISVRVDALSVTMFVLVSFVGLVVMRFSQAYLAGEPRHGVFLSRLSLALAAVSMLVLSGNLVHLGLSWMATSMALHPLLLFYAERPRAQVAARKKFIMARLGDVLLVTALAILAGSFGTTDLTGVLEGVRQTGGSPGLSAAAVLLAVAACLKSAQFPTHGWLVEVMETPTPVSALLHAGIVNAGGFLLIRLSDVVTTSELALLVLLLVGGLSALVGSLVMLTQPGVKTSLAYSTVAQMGFMLLQCGLGAFSSAVVHLVAHSLYKAHAFLSSGSAVSHARRRPRGRLSGRSVVLAAGYALAAFAVVGWSLGVGFDKPGLLVLGAALVLSLTHLMLAAKDRKSWLRAALSVPALALAYFAIQLGAAEVLNDAVAPGPLTAPALVWTVAVAAGFVLLSLAQWVANPLGGALPRALYVHARNGFYVNAVFDRWTGTISGARTEPAGSRVRDEERACDVAEAR